MHDETVKFVGCKVSFYLRDFKCWRWHW